MKHERIYNNKRKETIFFENDLKLDKHEFESCLNANGVNVYLYRQLSVILGIRAENNVASLFFNVMSCFNSILTIL